MNNKIDKIIPIVKDVLKSGCSTIANKLIPIIIIIGKKPFLKSFIYLYDFSK